MKGGGFAIFLTAVLTVWTLMHVYVFWHLSSLPWVVSHCHSMSLWLAATGLWLSYPVARILNTLKLERIGVPLEFVGAVWLGCLFLLLAMLLVVDIATVGGLLFSQQLSAIQSGAVVTAGVLSLISFAQGLRPPVIRNHEVSLPGLPTELDGLTMVALSDLHLGTLKGKSWLQKLVSRVNRLSPDLVVIVGDLVDGNVEQVTRLLPELQQLRARLGIFAVTGNHEYYAGLEASVALLEAAGYQVLRDRWAEPAPGLIIAGVDDLTARQQFRQHHAAIGQALAHRPSAATVLLSHSPMETERAETAGINLMLSGHTHGGQLWPFSLLVRMRYRFLAGRYEVGGMSLLVCRGTGTWGPPLRLWRPSEILRIKLRT